VLLVSYFSSTCKELFRKSVDFISLHESSFFSPIKEDIKLSFSEISEYEYNLSGNLGRIIIDKKNISFQDMQSIERSFSKYLLIESKEISKDVNNIILAQASRHCIVHSSEIADEKFLYQIRDASNRDVIQEVKLNDKISVTPKEIDEISNSMHNYLTSKVHEILSKIE